MNKTELITSVSEKASKSKADTSAVVDALFATISEELGNGGEVRVVGFGNFYVTHRKASQGRNPRTGEPIQIKASNLPKFKAGKGLKDSVNG